MAMQRRVAGRWQTISRKETPPNRRTKWHMAAKHHGIDETRPRPGNDFDISIKIPRNGDNAKKLVRNILPVPAAAALAQTEVLARDVSFCLPIEGTTPIRFRFGGRVARCARETGRGQWLWHREWPPSAARRDLATKTPRRRRRKSRCEEKLVARRTRRPVSGAGETHYRSGNSRSKNRLRRPSRSFSVRPLRSSRSARAVSYRSSARFAVSRPTICSSCAGRSGDSFVSGVG